jgi:serine/threonine protein kinase
MNSHGNPELRSDDITIGILLGKSRFGDVFVGCHHRSSRFAVKRLFQYASTHCRDALRSEMNSIRNLSSEFVVDVHAVNGHHASPDQPVLLIMERLQESLFSAYRALPAPSLRQRIEWLVQAGKAVSVFHSLSPPVLHCNITPSSMLVSSPASGRRLKMVDFRARKVLRDLAASDGVVGGISAGDPRYMAPELISCKPNHTTFSDVYSFGVVVWEICRMRHPFADCDDMNILKTDIKNGMREDFPLEFPIQLKEMILQTWITDPTQRPSIDYCVTVLENFLTELNKATHVSADFSNCTWPIKKEASAPEFDQTEAVSAIFLVY